MVAVPKSKGCLSCLSRKVKCDETHPQCLRCIKRGVQCPGYDRRFKFHDQTSRLRERHCRESASSCRNLVQREYHQRLLPRVTIDETIEPGLNQEALNIQTKELFHGFVMYYLPGIYSSFCSRVEVNWMDFVRNNWLTFPPALVWAIRALNVFHMAAQKGNSEDLLNARQMYGRAIRDFISLLQSQSALTDESLATAVLLGGYEILDGSCPHSWVLHSRGIRQIMCARGPEAHKAGMGRTLMLSFRPFLVAEAFMHGEPCFLGQPEWTSMVNDIARTEDRRGQNSLLGPTVDYAFNEIAKCPGYYIASRSILTSSDIPDPSALHGLTEGMSRAKENLLRLQTILIRGSGDTPPAASFSSPISSTHASKIVHLTGHGIGSAIALIDKLTTAVQIDLNREIPRHRVSPLSGFNGMQCKDPQRALSEGSTCSKKTQLLKGIDPTEVDGNIYSIGDRLDEFSLTMGMVNCGVDIRGDFRQGPHLG